MRGINERVTPRSRRGFTLVEILAVLVIIGIASAIVLPSLGSRDDLKTAAAARVLVADLIYAQNQAIATQKTVYVKFVAANNCYRVLTAAASSGDTVMSHPMTLQPYATVFGTVADPVTGVVATKGLDTVTIDSVAFSGIDSNYTNDVTLAFDEMGEPYAFDYGQNNKSSLKAGSIVLKSGTFTTTITVSPYTGELLVQ